MLSPCYETASFRFSDEVLYALESAERSWRNLLSSVLQDWLPSSSKPSKSRTRLSRSVPEQQALRDHLSRGRRCPDAQFHHRGQGPNIL